MAPTKLLYPPSFDCRVVCYPTVRILRDYISWRQVHARATTPWNDIFTHDDEQPTREREREQK